MIFAQAEIIDLQAAWQLLKDGGLLAGAVIIVFMFMTDRLYTPKRVIEANERTEKAERQRDEAMAIAKAQTDVAKEAGTTAREILQYLRDNLPRRRA